MHEGAEFGEVDVVNATIGGFLDMRSSKFNGEVLLSGAKIGVRLYMQGSKFIGKLNMDSIQVENDLFMDGKAEFGELCLARAKIGSNLVMNGSTFNGKLDMHSLNVAESLSMRNCIVKVSTPCDLRFCEIANNLDLTGSTLASLDLKGSKIHGAFQLATAGPTNIKWQEGAQLDLRNTEVGVLQGFEDSWPELYELGGFTYRRLGGFDVDPIYAAPQGNINWFIQWLKNQRSFSPDSYEHLADVFSSSGYLNKARKILYEGKEHERREAAGRRGYFWWLTMLKWTVGYGYVFRRAGYWALALTLLGWFFLAVSGSSQTNDIGFFYSLDMLLPIIQLRKSHYDIDLCGWVTYYFYFHTLMGYILGTFIIAGISRLTAAKL
jgi:hypothetical protein